MLGKWEDSFFSEKCRDFKKFECCLNVAQSKTFSLNTVGTCNQTSYECKFSKFSDRVAELQWDCPSKLAMSDCSWGNPLSLHTNQTRDILIYEQQGQMKLLKKIGSKNYSALSGN